MNGSMIGLDVAWWWMMMMMLRLLRMAWRDRDNNCCCYMLHSPHYWLYNRRLIWRWWEHPRAVYSRRNRSIPPAQCSDTTISVWFLRTRGSIARISYGNSVCLSVCRSCLSRPDTDPSTSEIDTSDFQFFTIW